MKTLRRTIHPVARVLDETKGIVEYIASNQTPDSYNEVIRADGWQFSRFQKNAPFVDSHNYQSIDCLLGKVIDFAVKGKNLVETVKWAIDVTENVLAQKGFAMTAAGYLKAVSVGFMPVTYCSKWDSDPSEYKEQCEELGIDPASNIRTIYTRQEQLELSACVIGANPDAVANVEKALRDGILKDSDIALFASRNPAFGREFEKRGHRPRTYSFGRSTEPDEIGRMMKALGDETPEPQQNITSKSDLLKDFDRIGLVTQRTFEGIESARRGGDENEIIRSVQRASKSLSGEYLASFGDPIERYLNAYPEQRYFWNGVIRMFGRRVHPFKHDSLEYKAVQKAVSGIALNPAGNVTGSLGWGLLFAIPVADELYDILLHYGQFKNLGLRKLVGQYTQYAEVTGYPNAIFITPQNQGQTNIPDDNLYSGTQIIPEANTIATIIKASLPWLQDEKVDFSNVIVAKIFMGLASRIDFGVFQGNGQDDQNNGMISGLFMNQNVPVFTTAAGKNSIDTLEREDFINTIALVAPGALQRMQWESPRWYINPVFIPKLLMLKDGDGPKYLLKTPAETQGEWMLCGFPVTWAGQAPVITTANARGVIAFGNPSSYLVSLHEQFELTKAEGAAEFADVSARFRAIARGTGIMRDAKGFAMLALSGMA